VTDNRVVVFTGGGTGGHIYPGLAVIESLRESFSGRIVWLGSAKESDRRVVEAAGIEYRALPAGKLRRSFSLENAADAFRVAAGFFAARRILKELRPALLFSKGGYVSVPPCKAAASLGIPVFTHESDLSAGLATRINAGSAERILVSYEETRNSFGPELRGRVAVVGNPVRAAIRSGDAAKGREILGAEPDLPIVMFIGGSQGARQVNELVSAIVPELTKRATVVHQTGEAAASPSSAMTLSTMASPAGRYRPFAYIRDEMPHLLAAADLIVGRSGASSLWEAGALGKPMVLVPLAGSGTRGDQVDNARLFEAAGAAKVLVGAEATPYSLLKAVLHFLDDPEAAKAAGEAAKGIAGRDAASAAATLILERIGGNS
jgi:UDP-N-acetylglucosamine--N-acetylmuramyl-(pentapeptide) pyrophosphoryl-undecaprenol N-acetylglucosamine transferase